MALEWVDEIERKAVEAQLDGSDSTVRCLRCGRVEQVNFAMSLLLGWPSCCGATMRLVETMADIEAAVARAIANARVRVEVSMDGA